MARQSGHRHSVTHRKQHACDGVRRALPDRVPKTDFVATHRKKSIRHLGDLLRRHRAIIRAFDHARNVATHRQVDRARRLDNRPEPIQAFCNTCVDIGPRKPLGGRAKDGDFVSLGGARVFVATHVGRQRRISDTLCASNAGQNLGRAGHLRHPLWAHKAGTFNSAKPCGAQRVDQGDLFCNRNVAGFVLQAIPWPDFKNFDVFAHAGMSQGG